VADFVPEANAAGIARMRNNLRLAADQLEAARVFELELAAARVENERLRSECHDGADRDSKIRQFRTEIARMQPEVTALPRVELRAYALKRARRIVRETPGDSDAWCDPEEWQSEAIELAHAVARLLDEAAGGIT
jgi:hypothetical protein